MSRTYMDRGATGWMYKYARKNYWRVCGYYDFDDLISEGHVCYYYVINKYPTAVDPPHIMRLFQLTYVGWIEDIVSKKRKQVDHAVGDIISDPTYHGCDPESATIATLAAQAPAPVKAVLNLLASEEGCKRLRKPYRRHRNGCRETLNDRLRKLTRFGDSETDLAGSFKSYFS